MPAPTRPSRSGRKLSPGTVYATLTPAAARASAMRRPAVRGVPVTDVPFLAVVGELERNRFVELAQAGDHLLEVVLALGADPHGVSLDLALRLRELVPQDLRDLSGEIVREPAAEVDVLANLHPARLVDRPPVEDLEREVPADRLGLDQLADRLRTELGVGQAREGVLLLGDLRGRALEVEARGDLAPDLVQRVSQLLGVELGDHVEGELTSHRFLRVARRARRGPAVVAPSMPIARAPVRQPPSPGPVVPTGSVAPMGSVALGWARIASATAAARSTRSSSATRALAALFASRSPDQANRRISIPAGSARATYVRPIGFPGIAPDGPAIPVMATARSTPSSVRAPAAIARAACALTAPCCRITIAGTPRRSSLMASAYATTPPRT